MGRKKVFTEEQIKENRTRQNIANYNRIIASQADKKRLNKSLETIERFLLGVEKLNKGSDNKITIDTSKMESLLRKAKDINLAVNIEASVRKMMTGEKVMEDSKMIVVDSPALVEGEK
jgi:23S rRNA A2030 N6-methylase RlmJ